MSEYIIKASDWAIDYKGESLFKGCREIVRCRDCKFLVPQINDDPLCIRPYENVALWTNQNGFCAWGKRKERKEQ